jgi:hypothetical protein
MVCKNLLLALQKTQYYSITKTQRLMPSKDIITIFCEKHTKHIHSVDKVPSFVMLKVVVLVVITVFYSSDTELSKMCHNK